MQLFRAKNKRLSVQDLERALEQDAGSFSTGVELIGKQIQSDNIVKSLGWQLEQKTCRWTRLVLGGNFRLKDEGAVAIGAGLALNTSVLYLGLWNCSVRAEGARSLARALAVNSTLTSLVLNGNPLYSEGAAELAGALPHNATLSGLAINNCRVGAAGAEALAAGLQRNRTLTLLDVSDNPLSPAGLRALAAGVRANYGLLECAAGNTTIARLGERASREEQAAQIECNRAIAAALENNRAIAAMLRRGGAEAGPAAPPTSPARCSSACAAGPAGSSCCRRCSPTPPSTRAARPPRGRPPRPPPATAAPTPSACSSPPAARPPPRTPAAAPPAGPSRPARRKAEDGDGATALHAAAEAGRADLLSALLRPGDPAADPERRERAANATRKDGRRVLSSAVFGRCGWRWRRGGPARGGRGGAGRTALHHAVALGQQAAAELLIARTASLEARDADGHAPLDLTDSERLRYALKQRARRRDVMISYGHQPAAVAAFARALRDALERARVTCWLDEMNASGIEAGSEWRAEIAEAIARASVVVFVASAHSVRSEWCRKELAVARELGRPIFPVWRERVALDAELEALLFSRQFVDFADPDPAAPPAPAPSPRCSRGCGTRSSRGSACAPSSGPTPSRPRRPRPGEAPRRPRRAPPRGAPFAVVARAASARPRGAPAEVRARCTAAATGSWRSAWAGPRGGDGAAGVRGGAGRRGRGGGGAVAGAACLVALLSAASVAQQALRDLVALAETRALASAPASYPPSPPPRPRLLPLPLPCLALGGSCGLDASLALLLSSLPAPRPPACRAAAPGSPRSPTTSPRRAPARRAARASSRRPRGRGRLQGPGGPPQPLQRSSPARAPELPRA
eukprot:tig00020780_g13787.t1